LRFESQKTNIKNKIAQIDIHQGKKNIDDSLEEYFKKEILEG